MRPAVRWFLVFVLAVDLAVVGLLVTGSLSETAATTAPPAPTPASEVKGQVTSPPAAATSVDALRRLGEQLAERASELDRRQAELDEALRGVEVLKLAGMTPAEEPVAPDEKSVTKASTAGKKKDKATAVTQADSFQRLQRAYENMEPDSAARALAELAILNRDAVVELLVGWKPRTSGAILDAMTQTDPALAAELSNEIFERRGNEGMTPVENGR